MGLDPLRAFVGSLLIGAIAGKRMLRETWTVNDHVDMMCSVYTALHVAIWKDHKEAVRAPNE